MKILRRGSGLAGVKNPVLTLGNFDGLHLGHQKILLKISQRAKSLGCPCAVYTFDPHPLKIVAPHKSPPLILDQEDKIRLIEGFGTDFLILARFTKEFASKHPREFVEDALVPMKVKEVWVGHDFSFGRGREGTVEHLKKLGEEFGFSVNVIPAYRKGGAVVSSSRIRNLIKEGEVKKAKALLGRNYSIKGKVVSGRNIGKEIGFPTANLKTSSELVPANGVYAAYAKVNAKTYPAVLNIGVAPTFGEKEKCVEVHMIGFKDDIYGKRMEVGFVQRLRAERPFPSKEALIRQIGRDVERAKRLLGPALNGR